MPFRRRRARRVAQSDRRRARARRLPSCIAATRATGMVRPSSIRSVGSRCGCGIDSRPRGLPSSAIERGVHGEVGRRDVVEVVPGDRERHRRARAQPRAVGRDDGGAADAGRVDEHLAAAVLLDERGRREVGIERLGAGGDARGSRRPRPRPAPRRRSGRTRARPWRRWSSPRRPARSRPAPGGPGARPRPPSAKSSSLGRVEVEHEVRGPVDVVGPPQRRVVLDRALVGEPQQRAPVVAQRVVHLALARPPPRSAPCAPSPGVYFGTFFCMNGSWPRSTRITDSGRSASPGRIRSATASR